MGTLTYRDLVCTSLLELTQSVQWDSRRLNERHLHHRFSHMLQSGKLSLGVDSTEATFHPEWPTRKAGTGIDYTIYKKTSEGVYVPEDARAHGRAGFLDFAVGDYVEPTIGIEFTLKRGWSREEITYDLLKLMDPYLPFELGASLNIIFRRDGSGFTPWEQIESALEDAYTAARERIFEAERELRPRELFVVVTEVLANNERQFWFLNWDGQVERKPPAIL